MGQNYFQSKQKQTDGLAVGASTSAVLAVAHIQKHGTQV
jgi:hypothetical protein